MSKVKVSLKQAIEFAQIGLVIECYVVHELQPHKHTQSHNRDRDKPLPRKIFDKDELRLSFDGVNPTKGSVGSSWAVVKSSLWKDDLTKTYTRERIQKEFTKDGCVVNSVIPYLVNQCKCLVAVKHEL